MSRSLLLLRRSRDRAARTYRLQLGPGLRLRRGARARAVPGRPRRLAPVPAAVVPGAARARRTATTSSTRPRSPRSSAARRRSARWSAAAREAGLGRDPRHRPEPHGGRRREPLLGRRELRRSSSTSTRRPAATGASSTSTTSPACARRTPRSSRRRTGWRSRSCARALVDGLRIDHPDGLADPAGYLRRLRAAGVEHVWVEKILDPGEQLRDWPVEGTVGYEFLNDVRGAVRRPGGRGALTALWHDSPATRGRSASCAFEAKLEQATTTFAREVERLRPHRRPSPSSSGCSPRCRSTAPTTAAATPSREDREVAARRGHRVACYDGKPAEFVTRFQQTTPPVMAKGVEDTAFYRYVRLLALNDVGGDPSRFGITVDAVPRGQPRARRALPAQPARHPDARHEALGRRARADRRAGRDGRASGRRTCAAG